MVDIKQLELLYFQNDEPVPYELKNANNKGHVLYIKPIKVSQWTFFENSLDIITQEKQDYDNIDILSMSYLDFLIEFFIPSYADSEGNLIGGMKLYKMLEMAIGVKDISYGKYRNKNCLVLDREIVVTAKEFEDIRKIILFQNIEDYDDRYVSPDVKQLYKDYLASTKPKGSDPSLERKKTFVIGKTGIMMNDINKMSYRIFHQIYVGAIENDIYYANKIIQASQKYDVKEDIVYPLFAKKKDVYSDLFVSKSSVENKLKKVNG